MMGIKFKSKKKISKIAADYKVTIRKAKKALKEASLEAAKLIWAEAILRTPKDRGDLEGSGEVKPLKPALKHEITFDTDYAAAVHDWSKKVNIGEASRAKEKNGIIVGRKYLTRARDENKKEITEILNKRLRRMLNGTSN